MAVKGKRPPAPPRGVGVGGARLWRELLARYEFEEHELVILRQAAKTVDLVDKLALLIERQGTTTADGGIAPPVVEVRQQRIVLARLLSSLRIPGDDAASPSARSQRRPGVRGVYSLVRDGAPA